MNSKSSIQYAVHNLTRYFSRAPGDLKSCPTCGNPVSISSISPSKNVSSDLSDPYLIPVHEFSRLYECKACQWWAVRERWTLCEWGKELDFLVVGNVARTPLEENEPQISAWKKVLEDEELYQGSEPLPDHLLQLFEGGKKQISFCPRLRPGDKISLISDVTLRQPTYYGPRYSFASQGSHGTIISYEKYESEYQQLSEAGRINLDYTKDFEAVWLPGAKRELEKGSCYAMRLEKLEPVSIDRARGCTLSKEGELYFVEISDVEKCAD
jgi:hypothetical protein